MKTIKPTPEHKAFRDDMLAVLRKHGDKLSATEVLALSAYTVGQIVAMQDQRKVTPQMAMKLVAENIELGNKQAIENLTNAAPAGRG